MTTTITEVAIHPAVPEILAEVVDTIRELEVPVDELKDTGDPRFETLAEAMGDLSMIASLTGNLQFSHVTSLSFFQAVAQEDPQERRKDLLNLLAVVVEWVRTIDERSKPAAPKAIAA